MNRSRKWAAAIAVVLIAANLRAPLTSVSPVLASMSGKLGM